MFRQILLNTLIQLRLLQGRRPTMRTTFLRYFRRIPHLRTHNHPRNHYRSRLSQRHRNWEVIIAHGNRRFTIDNILIVWELNLLLISSADLFCSVKFALFKWPFSTTRRIHAPLMPVAALLRCFPQVHAANFAQGCFRCWKCCSTGTQTSATTRT